MPKVTVYSKPGCHLCEDVKKELERLQNKASFELEEVNIDEDPELKRRYKEEIPVVMIDGQKAFKYHLDPKEFLKKLKARSASLLS